MTDFANATDKEELRYLLDGLVGNAVEDGRARFKDRGQITALTKNYQQQVESLFQRLQSENERLKETALTALRDAKLLAELVNIGPREPSNNLAEDATEGYRAAIRELLLPVATRLLTSLRRISGSQGEESRE